MVDHGMRSARPSAACVETALVPGARLHMVGVGAAGKRTLLIVHGGPGEAHDLLRPHLDGLASEERRVVYWDQRGGGGSALLDGAPHGTWQTHVADMEAVRRHSPLHRVDVLGFSWGALLAVLYALEHPGVVRRMVLVSPPALWGEAGSSPPDAAPRPVGSLRERFVARVAPALWDPSLASRLTPVEVDAAAAAAVWRSLGRYDLRPRLSSLSSLPTLVVQGAQDPLGEGSAADLVGLAGASRLTLSRCGHAPFVEATAPFLDGVRGFLDLGAENS